jgi:hypothetical protein
LTELRLDAIAEFDAATLQFLSEGFGRFKLLALSEQRAFQA